MGEKKLDGAGLRGQVAGKTALSTVGKEGKGLTYRGYAIEELAEKAREIVNQYTGKTSHWHEIIDFHGEVIHQE